MPAPASPAQFGLIPGAGTQKNRKTGKTPRHRRIWRRGVLFCQQQSADFLAAL